MSDSEIQDTILLHSTREQALDDVCKLLTDEAEKSRLCGDTVTAEVYELIRAKVNGKLRKSLEAD